MTINKPATPLPWEVSVREKEGDYAVQDIQGSKKEDIATLFYVNEKGASDAAYIAHTANAYPRLVEALLLATQYLSIAPHGEGYGVRNLRPEEAETMRALLRELGELSSKPH